MNPPDSRPPAVASVLTWTITFTAVLLGAGVASGGETRLVGLLAFMPGIIAGIGTVRQTLFVAAWCFGATLASVLYYPDPHHATNYFLIVATALFSAGAVYVCHRRTARERETDRLRITARAMAREILAPLPQSTAEVVVTGVYEPVDEDKLVGGDVYDVVAGPHGTRVLIGDVQGKGLAAIGAAFTIIGAFREAAYREVELTAVADALEAAVVRHNAFAAQAGREERFATALILHIAAAGTKAEAINCGHLQPVLLGRDGGPYAVEFADHGLPLGLAALVGDPRRSSSLELLPGETLLLYTDGLSETRSSKGEFYPPGRGVDAVRGVEPDLVAHALLADARRFAHGRQLDDIAILAVRRRTGTDAEGP